MFTGMDVPAPLADIRVSHGADFSVLHLEWDAPTIGYNGGYIDPSDLSYQLCEFDEEKYEWVISKDLGKTLSYDYDTKISDTQQSVEAGIL